MIDLVFLHGGGQGSWAWEETIAALRMQAGDRLGRVVTLDAPGCGIKRGRETAAIGFDAIVEELCADIDASGARDALLVGHSQAGTVLPRLIEARGERFRRAAYVTCSAPLPGYTMMDFRNEPGLENAAELRERFSFTNKSIAANERFKAMFCNDMADGDADAFVARLGPDMWPMSSYAESGWRYDCLGAVPATYVLCLQDATLLPSWQEIYAARLGVERIVRIDAAHQVMNTRPQALAEVLLAEAAA